MSLFFLKFNQQKNRKMSKKDKKDKKEDIENQEQELIQDQEVETTEEQTEEATTKEQEKPVDKAEELEAKLQEMNDKYLRLTAEFDNYRRRTLKEKMELTKSAGENILIKILPVIDNFERALQSIEQSDDVTALKEGVVLIYNNFKDFMTQNGVTEIEAINQEFDTDLHEAITKIPAPAEDMKGKVVDCIEKGYKLNDKVMRFSKVVVGE